MGREIRMVPPDWEHPVIENEYPHIRNGRYTSSGAIAYQPMHDRSYREACETWKDGYAAWYSGERERMVEQYGEIVAQEYWEWDGPPPDERYYRPVWPEESRTAYQIYETVTEGTPISPVFKTLEEMSGWLHREGFSREAIEYFIQQGYLASGLALPNGVVVTRPAEVAEASAKLAKG